MQTRESERRNYILIILLILLIGFVCIILTSGWALRFAPSWRLPANMNSNLNPNSDFLTSRPVSLFGPLDPSILTNPAWFNVFLTPGASFETPKPLPTSTLTKMPMNTSTPIPTRTMVATNTLVLVIIPTNTKVYVPPPPSTAVPAATKTPLPQSIDLQITKTDKVATYTPGSSVTYFIIVSNAGPSNVIGATVTDTFPAQITSTVWTCVSTAGATCNANGSGNISDTVNIPVGGSLTYTITANIAPTATGNLANTANISVPGGYADINPANNSATDTDTPAASSDLGITMTDNSTAYVANATKTYNIMVSNVGPSNAIGATVTDIFSANTNIASVSWICTPAGGAICAASGSGDINDTVNIPVGSNVTYTVTAMIVAAPSGDLVNTASVGIATDSNNGNNSATDIDNLVVTDPVPPGVGIGVPPDGTIYNLLSNSYLTLSFNINVSGQNGYDLVYYERPSGSGIWLDWVIIEIGDGSNWYQIFNWGDEIADTNTNMDFTFLLPPLNPPPPPPPPEEPDQRDIQTSNLYGSPPLQTGIAIDLDSLGIPLGTYPYIRFYAPPGDVDGHMEIDAIALIP